MAESVKIGTSNDCSIWLDHDVRQTHMHVIGLSRTGKSKFLEYLLRQDILAGNGVCLIDPHGELYDDLVGWLAVNELHQSEHIHLINPSDETWTVGFNPLAPNPDMEMSVQIDAMVDACVKVWGGGDVNQTPRLSRCLQVMFGALASRGLSIAEWQFFANWSYKHFRAELATQMDNPVLSREWEEIDTGLNQSDFANFFESTRNRLLEFTKVAAVREMMGQTNNVINFKRCMDEGHVVLVNLKPSGQLSKRNSLVIGALITNSLYATAFTRDKTTAKKRPFYCVIDECGQYLTEDVANSLDETAKYGLHFVLSHQRLEQLTRNGDELLNAVWAGAQVKVVFNCDDETMAEPLAWHLFRKSMDVQRVKERITQPVVVGYSIIELQSETVSETRSESSGVSDFAGSGLNNSSGLVVLYDANGNQISGQSVSAGEGASFTEGFGSSNSSTRGSSTSRSKGQALMPDIVERASTPMSLEEQMHEGVVAIRSLPPRQAFLYHRQLGTIAITTPTVRIDRVFDDERIDFWRGANDKSEFTHPRLAVRSEIKARADDIENPVMASDSEEDYLE